MPGRVGMQRICHFPPFPSTWSDAGAELRKQLTVHLGLHLPGTEHHGGSFSPISPLHVRAGTIAFHGAADKTRWGLQGKGFIALGQSRIFECGLGCHKAGTPGGGGMQR